ncbi:hypothetical protein FWC31_02705 [Candidatus Saccharibacteria bacterium]|nr:hypothetical protein [Candidatus Saccharibacteria bacterium]
MDKYTAWDMVQIVSAVIVMVCGLIMIIWPKSSTKKTNRDSEQMVKKTRKSGIILTIAGVLLLISALL